MKRILPLIVIVVISLVATGCGGAPKQDAQSKGQKQTEQAFAQQSEAVPYPADELKDSLERRNLRERLRRNNKADAISYLYIMSFGKPLGYYTIKGKVSSTQSQMTTSELITCKRHKGGECAGAAGNEYHVVVAPSDDGSYGENEQGIFFFTTEGAMVTTNLDYMVSDQPVPFDVPNLTGSAGK